MEGALRGLGREMTQQEIVRAVKSELKQSISQSYLSQIESGSRPHLTNSTRMLLARFFKVHPGYLVDDPEGFHTELMSDVRVGEDQLDLWLIDGAERFARDPEVSRALLSLAKHEDSRKCLLLLESILDTPGLADRLFQVLQTGTPLACREEGKQYELGNFLFLLLLRRLPVQPALVLGRFHASASALAARIARALRRMARAAKDRRSRRSISEPSRRSWPGSAARAICSAAIRASGRCWRWRFALLSGLVGAAAVFWFLFKVLLKHERDLDPADYEMVGVLGRVSSTVRENGTGEMIFSQNGVRRAASARSEDGRPIAKGVEVVVTRYERGIAYVRPWEEISEGRRKEN